MRTALLLVICSMLLTLGAPAAIAQDGVTLQFWTRIGGNETANNLVTSLVDEWNEANPDIQIDYLGIPGGEYRTKLLTSIAGGTAPDIVGMDVAIMPQYMGLEALYAVDDLISQEMRADFGEGLWFSNTANGQTFGVPWWSDPSAIFYNKSLLEGAGVEPPETWEDLRNVVEAVTQLTDDPETEVYGVVLPVVGPWVMFIWLPYLWGNGADLVDAYDCAAFNNDAGIEAMQLWVDIFQAGQMPRSAVFGDGTAAITSLFYSDRVGMYTSGPGMYRRALEINPELDLGTIVMPRPEDGNHSAYLGGDNLVILKGSEHPEEAWQFIEWLVDAQRMTELAEANNGLYIAGLITRESAFTDDHFERYAYQQAFAQAQAVGRAPNTVHLSEARMPVWENFQAALDGQMSVEDAMSDAELRVNEITGCDA